MPASPPTAHTNDKERQSPARLRLQPMPPTDQSSSSLTPVQRMAVEWSTSGPSVPRSLTHREGQRHSRRASEPVDPVRMRTGTVAIQRHEPHLSTVESKLVVSPSRAQIISPTRDRSSPIADIRGRPRGASDAAASSALRRPPTAYQSPAGTQHPSSPTCIPDSPNRGRMSPTAAVHSRWNRVQMPSPTPPPVAHGSPQPGISPYSPGSPSSRPQIQPQYGRSTNFTRGARRQAYIERGPDDDPNDRDDGESHTDVDEQRPGTLDNLAELYGGSGNSVRRRTARYNSYGEGMEMLDRTDSLESIHFRDGLPMDRGRGRTSHRHEILDEDDPRLTGKKVNRIDDQKRAAHAFMKGRGGGDSKGVDDLTDDGSYEQRRTFLLRLAKALMRYGAPSHRLESQLAAAARIMDIDASFVHLPSLVIASVGQSKGNEQHSETHFIKAAQGLSLGKLHDLHIIYRRVMHHDIGVVEGTRQLDTLLKSSPLYGLRLRILLAFLCTFLICPLAFHGSITDALVSGCGGAILCWLQLHVAQNNPLYANVFEISIAILMAFVARGLSSIRSHIFCYDAISSSGVVLILPGYTILCSALELASKNIVCGSVRMIYAIIYSLFLGFGLTIGSDFYLLIDSGARREREMAALTVETLIELHGIFKPDNNTTPFAGTFSFSNQTSISANIVEGCYREPTWPWYLQEFPWWTLFILVPTFSFVSSLGNMQPLKTKELPVMVLISCASFAANTAANAYIFDRSDVVSAIGAFVVGVLGNLYSRAFKGTAFTAMVTGILFLVPSGLSAAGGLAQNYKGQNVDQYSNGLQIGVRMVQVAIGITVGVFGSGLLVYSFGRRKTGATFAF